MQKPKIRKKIKVVLFYKYKKQCLKIKMLEDTLENLASEAEDFSVTTPKQR